MVEAAGMAAGSGSVGAVGGVIASPGTPAPSVYPKGSRGDAAELWVAAAWRVRRRCPETAADVTDAPGMAREGWAGGAGRMATTRVGVPSILVVGHPQYHLSWWWWDPPTPSVAPVLVVPPPKCRLLRASCC